MLTLQFELEHQKINLVNRWETVATDSKNYLVASFSTISDDWTTPITAIFTNDKDEQPYAVVVGADSTLESNECYVPWEVLKDESNVYVSAYCGNLHTTVTAQFHVYKSGYADGETPPPPSPTVYDAIMQAITNLQNGKQDKLTAGKNITISNDNVISAEGGGVTSYDDLTDKPYVTAENGSGTLPHWQLTNGLNFDYGDFGGIQTVDGQITIRMLGCFSKYHLEPRNYDFNDISSFKYNGYLKLDNAGTTGSNFPSALNKIDITKPCFVYQALNTSYNGDSQRYMLRKVIGQSSTGEYLEYAQMCNIWYNKYSGDVLSQTDWVELSGGSQIVSGVVNANGTITFTDSDGNTFTTSGSSVIGTDGFSPVATVTQTASGATVSITDSTGTTTANISNGQDGSDYVLTAQDKSDIANIVLSELPTTQGVLYGNTSN